MGYIFFFLLIGSVTAFSQSMQVGTIHDYAVGDVFQTRSNSGSNNPPLYQTDTILNRYSSADLDTLFYTVQRHHFVPAACPTCSPNFSRSTITLAYTNLTSPGAHFSAQSCSTIVDTIYNNSDYCGLQTWERHSTSDPADSNCFEPPYWYSKFIAGAGGPYYYDFNPSMGPYVTEHKLIYLKKGGIECGTLITSVELTNNVNFQIYPNPVSDQLNLQGFHSSGVYKIFNSIGETVVTGVVERQIDVSKLVPGSYIIELNCSTGSLFKRFIKI